MIKFFRHIRQNLIMENKTGKYLKYAIGEIVLGGNWDFDCFASQ